MNIQKNLSDCLWDYRLMSVVIEPSKNNNPHGVVSCGDINESTCKRIINEHKNPNNLSVVGKVQRNDGYVTDTKIRDVDAWIIREDADWINDLIVNTTHTALEHLNYEVVGLLERPQLLRYNSPSSGYRWHTDIGQKDSSIRKISISINLNDSYDGGSLLFFSDNIFKLKMHRGMTVAFPSFLSHKVMPITKGTRWSLVAWISGHPFR